jgi:hypothetical protein
MGESSYRWDVSQGFTGGVDASGVGTTESGRVTVCQGGYVIWSSGDLPPEQATALYDKIYELAVIHNREMIVLATLPRP